MSIPEEPRATGQRSAGAYGYPGNAHAGWAEAAAEGVTGAGTEAGLLAEVRSPPLRQGKMSRFVCWWLFFGLGSLLARQAEAPSPVEPPERSRPYAVLRGQNLVLMGTIFSILLVTMILMALCVYKPIRRR
ncbi:uncharacterized protein LOC118018565 [Mirounga leonina]|uniref:uncharacterized protein LOC118018565 n=2 Tax=Mirounga TaxID=9714 RepID=UPI00156C508C|nr:uncharacterized protein LOC118018565 [Mirounga leonina]